MSNIFDSMLGDQIADSDEVAEDAVANHDSESMETASNDAGPLEPESVTPLEVKSVIQELLKSGCVEESKKDTMFRSAMMNSSTIEAALEPLDLTMRLDEIRGIAFLKVRTNNDEVSKDEWSHPLVRRQRLTLEQSLMIAILRQAFVTHEQEMGIGESKARIAVDELLPQFRTFFGDSGSDQKDESRLLNVLDQLKTHGIISEVDKKQEVNIRPLIAHLADPASLNSLLQAFQEQAGMNAMDSEFGSDGDSDVE